MIVTIHATANLDIHLNDEAHLATLVRHVGSVPFEVGECSLERLVAECQRIQRERAGDAPQERP
jgi:hypothetical protein